MAPTKILRLILGDQLNRHHTWFNSVDSCVTFVLMEIRQETDYVKHHIQKVAAFFAAMRAFAEELSQDGHRVIYIKLDDKNNHQNLEKNINALIRQKKFTQFEYQLPDEFRLDLQLHKLTETLPIPVIAVDSEHFLTARDDLKDFFDGKKRYLMESFYRMMRKRHNILIDSDGPVGGQWNFDQKNRQAYDSRWPIPDPILFNNNVTDICRTINRSGVKTFGQIEPDSLIWPVNRDQSIDLLNTFVSDDLPVFGTYQDAMTTANWHLFHSRLSFALNTKMLNPLEVIDAVISAWEDEKSPYGIQQIEGFIRQVLGWREYMRGVYWAQMPGLDKMNYFEHSENLPDFYWTGETQMKCLAQAIGQSLKYAYAHHIQRLMVTGNFALLAGVHPDQVDQWYLGVYIDAVQWVELPNTRAMSQFADGGKVATKPYISSANYIKKMSDYCQSCEYGWQKRYGRKACPFNSFYWSFFNRHRDRLQKNPRVGMMYRTWDRMKEDDRNEILKQADIYRKDLNLL